MAEWLGLDRPAAADGSESPPGPPPASPRYETPAPYSPAPPERRPPYSPASPETPPPYSPTGYETPAPYPRPAYEPPPYSPAAGSFPPSRYETPAPYSRPAYEVPSSPAAGSFPPSRYDTPPYPSPADRAPGSSASPRYETPSGQPPPASYSPPAYEPPAYEPPASESPSRYSSPPYESPAPADEPLPSYGAPAGYPPAYEPPRGHPAHETPEPGEYVGRRRARDPEAGSDHGGRRRAPESSIVEPPPRAYPDPAPGGHLTGRAEARDAGPRLGGYPGSPVQDRGPAAEDYVGRRRAPEPGLPLADYLTRPSTPPPAAPSGTPSPAGLPAPGTPPRNGLPPGTPPPTGLPAPLTNGMLAPPANGHPAAPLNGVNGAPPIRRPTTPIPSAARSRKPPKEPPRPAPVNRAGRLRLRVNPITCAGHGICAELLPELLSLDDWSYPSPIVAEVPADLESHAQRAAQQCPTLAIVLERRRPKPTQP